MATRLFSCPYSPPCRLPPSWPGATLHAYNRKLLCASVLTPRVPPAAYGAGTLNRGGLRTGAAPADRITDYGIRGDLSPSMLTPSRAWPTDARSPLPPRVRGQFWVRIVATYRPGYPSLGVPALVRSCALLSVVPVWCRCGREAAPNFAYTAFSEVRVPSFGSCVSQQSVCMIRPAQNRASRGLEDRP
jgi:hypothetical protein